MPKNPKHFRILVIRSPFRLPGHASRTWHQLLSDVKALYPEIETNDAATDFVVQGLSMTAHLNQMVARVRSLHQQSSATTKGQEDPPDIQGAHGLEAMVQRLARDATLAAQRLAEAQHDDPYALFRDASHMDTLMDLASRAYQPCRFHRHGFGHTGIENTNDLQAFVTDTKANPFWYFAHHIWRPFSEQAPPALGLLYVASPGQVAPAATLAKAWRHRWPGISLHPVGPKAVLQLLGPAVRPKTTDQTSAQIDLFRSQVDDMAINIFDNTREDTAICVQPSNSANGSGVQPLIVGQMGAVVEEAIERRIPLIEWQPCQDSIKAVTQQLYQASRQGVWNHLRMTSNSPEDLEQFARTNANIVHSYSHQETASGPYDDPEWIYPDTSPAYGHTQSMPGKPLWMVLGHTGWLQQLLNRLDMRALMRMRILDDDNRLFQVGDNPTYHFKSPEMLPEGHLDEIVNMVAAGGSVNTQFVKHNLERAYLIAYVEEEGVIVGNSSLKRPRDEYMDAVSAQSGIDLHHFLERGYTSVRPEYRGLGVGAKLLEGLTQRAGDHKIFSVIAETNIATQKMAIRNNTRRVATFYSQRAHKEMSVWIPEWMLPEGIELPDQPTFEDDHSGRKDNA